MIDLEQQVEMTWVANNKSFYINKGYNYTKLYDKFFIHAKDLFINSHKKVKIICDYCKKSYFISFKSYNHLKSNSIIKKDSCKDCCPNKLRESNMFKYGKVAPNSENISIEDLKIKFKKRNYVLLDDNLIGIIINDNTRLYYKCDKHPDEILNITYNAFKHSRGCKYCGKENAAQKTKLDLQNIKDVFILKGYKLLNNNYINSKQLLDYICPKHPNIIQHITISNLKNNHGCSFCYRDNNRGENHPSWKGGISEISDFLRSQIDEWKFESLKFYNSKCLITANTNDLIIHHLYPFSQLVKDTFEELKLKIKKSINQYTKDELKQISDKCLELHYKQGFGIPLQNNIHKLLHSMMGISFIDSAQFNEFKQRYLAGEFKDVM